MRATLTAFGGVGGVPSGLACHIVLRAGDESGITNWDSSAAPKSDAQGHVVFDPAPAGDITVQCYDFSDGWSDGAAYATLAAGGSAAVTLPVVKNVLPSDAPNIGSVGLRLGGELGGRIAGVDADSPAARAGIAAGDEIVAVDGAPVAGLTPGGVYVLLMNHAIGAKVTLGIRHGTAIRTVTLTMASPQH